MTRPATLALSLSLLALPASANSTIDHVHATPVTIVGVAGDLLTEGSPPGPPAPPVVAIPAAAIGLVAGDEIDAVSWGNDPIAGPHRIIFSVGVGAIGLPGSGVAGEVALGTTPSSPIPLGVAKPPEAAGDLFQQSGSTPACSNVLAPAGSGYRAGSGTGDEFNASWATPAAGPLADDLDAFDFTDPATPPPGGIYFSLAPGSPSLIPLGATPGDVLWSPLGGGPPAIAILFGVGPATDAALGIPGANLDALNLVSAGPGVIAAGTTGPAACGALASTHLVEYSIAPGGVFVPSAVLVPIAPGVAGVKVPPGFLGLASTDNLDALEAIVFRVPVVPSAGPAAVALIVGALAGIGMALARRGRRNA